MPKEYDFMKTRDEKGMPGEEYKQLYEQYNKKAESLSKKVQSFIFISIALLLASYILINIIGASIADFKWLAVEFIFIAIFLYDPKIEEDKRYQYEADQKILLKSIQGKIKLNKIRLGFVIFFVAVFVILNGVLWYIVSFQNNDGADLRFVINKIFENI